MRKDRMAATRFFIIVIILMTFFILSGPTVFARQGPPQVPPGKDTLDVNKEDKHEDKNRGWDKVVEKFIENGITLPGHVNNSLFDYVRDALKEDEDLIPMVMVGEIGVDYTVPISFNDTFSWIVSGGYMVATYETTFGLWYEVLTWAESNAYIFSNKGREGSHGIDGALPTDNHIEPVARASWLDVIVWINALSELHGYDPVYRTIQGDIIRNATSNRVKIVKLNQKR